MLGNSLLSQFEDIKFHRETIPFVDSPEKVDAVVRQVNETAMREGQTPIVFSSIVDEIASGIIRRETHALTLDLFQVFIAPLEAELKAKSSHAAGRSHGIANSHEYFSRIDAINFTQSHDDGAATRELGKAQVILVGVSRCSSGSARQISPLPPMTSPTAGCPVRCCRTASACMASPSTRTGCTRSA